MKTIIKFSGFETHVFEAKAPCVSPFARQSDKAILSCFTQNLCLWDLIRQGCTERPSFRVTKLPQMLSVQKERKWKKVKSLSRLRLFATPWTVAHQAPLSMEFFRQEYWSGLPFPSPSDLNPGIEPGSPVLRADTLPFEPPRKANATLSNSNTKIFFTGKR